MTRTLQVSAQLLNEGVHLDVNWEAIVAIVEVVGLLAVVISLIYVAVQVRQNSQLLARTIQSVRTQTYQYLVGGSWLRGSG